MIPTGYPTSGLLRYGSQSHSGNLESENDRRQVRWPAGQSPVGVISRNASLADYIASMGQPSWGVTVILHCR
jgi:hypothetical protein